LLPRFQPPKSKKLAVYANPDFSGQGVLAANPSTNALLAMREVELRDFRSVQLPPLQGTAKESAALVSWAKTWGWPTESYVAAEASEAQLRAVESPYILHLATHGFFLPEEKPEETENELGWRGIGGVRPPSPSGLSMEPDSLMRPRIFLKNPMHRSGLALAGAQTTLDAWKRGDVPPTDNDGIVTADEVGTLNLDSTWLVVLSACDTGAGEARSGEGVLGLRRGFVQAGAQNLLLTLWKIRDEETAKFMVNFYDAAHASGDAAQALAEVQRDWLVKLRKERGLQAAVQLAGPFILSSQGEVK
jgi:CHAT domain-containing protein